MPTLSEERIAELLEPYFSTRVDLPGIEPIPATEELLLASPGALYGELSVYLDLLVRWNARTNLTAIRAPEAIVQRHFGESLFAGRCLGALLRPGAAVLDFGSGAGFPGLPIQLLLPELRVTLAESQGKKASFLREAARTLNSKAEVWSGRVEDLPADMRHECVTMRAVDKREDAAREASFRLRPGGWLVELLAGDAEHGTTSIQMPGLHSGYIRFTKT